MNFEGKALLSFVPGSFQNVLLESRGQALKYGHRFYNERIVAILDISGKVLVVFAFYSAFRFRSRSFL